MEENKISEAKTIKMSNVKEEQNSKMSYEQLEQIANQLAGKNRELINQVNAMNISYITTVLDFMLKIVEIDTNRKSDSKHSFNDDFMEYVINEVEKKIYQLTSPQESKEEEEDNTNATNN